MSISCCSVRRLYRMGTSVLYVTIVEEQENVDMRYMLLIYGNEAAAMNATQAEQQAEMDAYNAFTQEVRQNGASQGGEALHPVSSATTVRVRDGKTLTTDGPFAETKEQLGGFYLFTCKNLDEAIEYAAKIPGAKSGSIEIRPIVEWE